MATTKPVFRTPTLAGLEKEEEGEESGYLVYKSCSTVDDFSAVGEESDTMPNISDHARELSKKKKQPKKKKSKKKRRRIVDSLDGAEQSGADLTDSEAQADKGADKKKVKKVKKKSKKNKELVDELTGEINDKPPKKKNSSKRKKEKQVSNDSTSVGDGQLPSNAAIHPVDANLPKEGFVETQNFISSNHNEPTTDTEFSRNGIDFVKGADGIPASSIALSVSDYGSLGDSDSSELPDPSDLDDDSDSEGESPIQNGTLLANFEGGLLGVGRSDSEKDLCIEHAMNFTELVAEENEVDIQYVSSHSIRLSVPPQAINGSLAMEIVESARDLEQTSNHSVRRTKKYRMDCKTWIILALAILLVSAGVVIVLLVVGDDEKKQSTPSTTSSPSLRPTTITLSPSHDTTHLPTILPTASVTQGSNIPTADVPDMLDLDDLKEILAIDDELDSETEAALNWLVAEGWPVDTADLTSLQHRFVLSLLYFKTNGESWTSNNMWLSEDQVCSWYGISCTANNTTVEGLNLTSNGIQGAVPTQLGLLSTLKQLDLGMNDLTTPLMSELGMLTNLELLDIPGSSVFGSIPSELGLLTALTSLKLNNNELTGNIPSELALLISLLTLQIDTNYIEGTIPSDLSQLTLLHVLSLHDNRLTGTVPSALGNLTDSLISFTLHDNFLFGNLDAFCGESTLIEFTADCEDTGVICSCCTKCEGNG